MTQFIGMRAHIHGIGRQWPVPFSELCTLRAAGTIRPRTWDSASEQTSQHQHVSGCRPKFRSHPLAPVRSRGENWCTWVYDLFLSRPWLCFRHAYRPLSEIRAYLCRGDAATGLESRVGESCVAWCSRSQQRSNVQQRSCELGGFRFFTEKISSPSIQDWYLALTVPLPSRDPKVAGYCRLKVPATSLVLKWEASCA